MGEWIWVGGKMHAYSFFFSDSESLHRALVLAFQNLSLRYQVFENLQISQTEDQSVCNIRNLTWSFIVNTSRGFVAYFFRSEAKRKQTHEILSVADYSQSIQSFNLFLSWKI